MSGHFVPIERFPMFAPAPLFAPLRRALAPALALGLCLLPAPLLAQAVCEIDIEAVDEAIDKLRPNYGTEPDFGCRQPGGPGQELLCRDLMAGDKGLWKMSQLDDMAWAYAYSNATGTEHNPGNPQRDAAFLEKRDGCQDADCLCAAFIEHTNDSLGGMSPYPL